MLMDMSTGTLLSLEEYLNTSYSPDREYRDGALVERNVGEKAHALLQAAVGSYLNGRRRKWNIHVYTALRVRIREKWYPIADVCVYRSPDFEGRYPSQQPLLWIEILAHDDRMVDVWAKANELVEHGVPYVWIIDPNTLESQLRSPAGSEQVSGKTLCIPGTPIVIPLAEALEE
jgi:Uma2 family endonuclease